MKIAISGSSGTGKSTLAAHLAQRLSIQHIDENYQPLYDARLKADFPPRLFRILENKRNLEAVHPQFVTDRCPIDLMHTWLNQACHKFRPREVTEKFFNLCLQQTKAYDFVIVTPWNSLPLEQNSEALPRDMDIMEQLRHHAAVLGHVHMWVPKPRIIEIPQAMTVLEARLDFIIDQIKQRRPELLQAAS